MCALVSQVILEQGANRVGFVKEVYIEIKRANVQHLLKQQQTSDKLYDQNSKTPVTERYLKILFLP